MFVVVSIKDIVINIKTVPKTNLPFDIFRSKRKSDPKHCHLLFIFIFILIASQNILLYIKKTRISIQNWITNDYCIKFAFLWLLWASLKLKVIWKSPRVKEAPKAITYEYSKQTAIIINSQVFIIMLSAQTRFSFSAM